MDDLINQPPQAQDAPVSSKQGHWLRRLLLGLLILCAVLACAFFWFTHHARSQPPYSTALELIQNDSQLIEHLGEPIRNVRWLPSGNYPTQFQIQVKGPLGMADVSVTAGEFDGEWEVTALDARVYDADHPHDTATTFPLDIGTSEDDAPAWPPAGTASQDTGGDVPGLEPPAGINLEPPGSGPAGEGGTAPEGPPMNIELPSVPAAPQS